MQDTPSIKTAYYFGVFDPVHKGHVEVAKKAIQQFQIEKLMVVPSYQPPHKQQPQLPFETRYEKLVQLFETIPQVVISKIESELPPPNYTYQTLKAIIPNFEQVSEKIPFIIGADALEKIATWYQPEKLCEKLFFIVAPRNSIDIKRTLSQLPFKIYYEVINMAETPESSTAIRKKEASNL